jgi:hypothetical protein
MTRIIYVYLMSWRLLPISKSRWAHLVFDSSLFFCFHCDHLFFFFERKRQELCPSFKEKEFREYKQRSETGQTTSEHTQREAKPHTLNPPG